MGTESVHRMDCYHDNVLKLSDSIWQDLDLLPMRTHFYRLLYTYTVP
jgi:hypothetical protein